MKINSLKRKKKDYKASSLIVFTQLLPKIKHCSWTWRRIKCESEWVFCLFVFLIPGSLCLLQKAWKNSHTAMQLIRAGHHYLGKITSAYLQPVLGGKFSCVRQCSPDPWRMMQWFSWGWLLLAGGVIRPFPWEPQPGSWDSKHCFSFRNPSTPGIWPWILWQECWNHCLSVPCPTSLTTFWFHVVWGVWMKNPFVKGQRAALRTAPWSFT